MEEKNQGEQKPGERRRSHGRRRRKNSQNTNAPKQQERERTRERSGHRKEREPKKHNGYHPDTGKDAIRVFDLGTYEEEGKRFLFHYDKGTYTIAELTAGETVQLEDGTEEIRYTESELLSTRDKAAAYKAWNEIKRPKKGKGARE
ncbi:MAG: hypothetical protein IJJ13_07765 [Lachnospiraceae bacterium]|nr:hypothetical protein [Lachnospiraceae bacterium]